MWCTQPPPTQAQGTALQAPTPSWSESAAVGWGCCLAWHSPGRERHTLVSPGKEKGRQSGPEGGREQVSVPNCSGIWAGPPKQAGPPADLQGKACLRGKR